MFATITVFAFTAIYIQSTHGVVVSKYYDSLCTGAENDPDGTIRYAAHPTNCDKYVQCHVHNNMIVVGEERLCPFSTFWDNVLTTCVGVKEANCMMDPCTTLTDNTVYVGNGNCRGYWKCMAKQSEAQCCKIGEVFDSASGCIDDFSKICNASCFNDAVPEPEECDKRTTLDANEFEQQTSSGGWLKMKCSTGTSYDKLLCDCAKFSDTPGPPPALCKPEIYLPFDIDTNDQSGNRNSVLNTNVQVRNGSAIFDVTSLLIIPRLNNLDHIASIRINVKYISKKANLGRGTVPIATNDAGNGHSISITEDSTNVYCSLKTTEAPNGVEITIPHSGQTSYKDVTFMVDSGIFTCSLGAATNKVEAPGYLQTVKSGLRIGFTHREGGFSGQIDEITVYLCNPLLKNSA